MPEELAEFDKIKYGLLSLLLQISQLSEFTRFSKKKIYDIGVFIWRKAGLVDKGFIHIIGRDYDETFAHVSRLESICIFLSYSAHKAFKFHQMDVNNCFLNDELNGWRSVVPKRTMYSMVEVYFEERIRTHHSGNTCMDMLSTFRIKRNYVEDTSYR